jgi:hypothetical protein
MASRRVLDPTEEVDELRAQLRQFPLCTLFTGRGRGIGASPVSMTSSMQRSGGSPGGAPPSTSTYPALSTAKAGSSAPVRRSSASAMPNDARCSSVPSRRTSTP